MNLRHYAVALPALALLLFNCQADNKKPNPFVHDLKGATPWSYAPTGRADSAFTFAIISDLNGGEREGIFNVAVEQINLLQPEFILSVGDLIDGGTEDVAQLKKEYDSFDERAAKAKAPLFHVGGNHDLTNRIMQNYWEERYGRSYYHFIYQNVLFLVLNSEDFTDERMQEIFIARAKAIEILDGDHPENADTTEYFQRMKERISGNLGEKQNEYFEKVIADHPEVRWTFILMHKPVWQGEGEGNLAKIEAALGSRKYTVINGHFHSYSHTVRNGHDYIMLGTTGGAQDAKDPNSFDHITLVSYNSEGPAIANIRMDGILDKTGKIPLDGDQYCYQASKCKE